MDKLLPAIALILCLGIIPATAQSAQHDQDNATTGIRPSERFGRGIINIGSSPLELPAQMYIRAVYQNDNKGNAFAVIGGFIEGIPMGLIYFPWRLTAGLYDVLTFPFKGCNASIITPEYLSFSTKWLEKKSSCDYAQQ